jgi:hypothetical protein
MTAPILIILAFLALLVAWFGLSATDSCNEIPEGKNREVCYIIQEGGNA